MYIDKTNSNKTMHSRKLPSKFKHQKLDMQKMTGKNTMGQGV